MKRTVGLFAITLAGPALTGCVMEGSGVLETRSFELPPFRAVVIGHGADLDVRIAPESTATITLDDNLFDALRVEVDDGTLRVEFAGGFSYTNVNLSAEVEVPSLRGLELSGDSWARARLEGEPRLRLDLSGASMVELEANAIDDLSVKLSGGSVASVQRGRLERLSVDASGGSRTLASTVLANHAEVSMSGGSRAELKVNQRVTGHLSGGSQLRLHGDLPVIDVERSGGSTVDIGP